METKILAPDEAGSPPQPRSAVAVRMPAYEVALSLIRAAGRPIAAPSANRFGRLSLTSHDAMLAQLGEAVDAIIAGGAILVGIELHVLDETGGAAIVTEPVPREGLGVAIMDRVRSGLAGSGLGVDQPLVEVQQCWI